jgi:hypothetical protein
MNWAVMFGFMGAVIAVVLYLAVVVMTPLLTSDLVRREPVYGFIWIFLTVMLPVSVFAGLASN